MEHRFSLSMNSPRLSNPIADSTWIDGPPTLRRPSTLQLSPKQRSNSSTCLSSSYTNETPQNKTLHQISRTSTSISRMTRQKLNLSQIDPKTYADVHSSGLASRIVKYHQESSAGLQRSMSFNNLYNPITQPRRTSIAASPLTHKPNLPSLSMTRIAPPERSFYCGNTLPSLLRSNSLLGVEKCSEQLSRENRPIMHPQPLQHESEPTRSVLEELKEISRKRINSGDIQQNDYNTKKSCNRMTDFVDHHNLHTQQQQMSMLQSQSGFKRQRELSVAVPLRLHHAPIVLPLQHHHPQQQHPQQQQHQQQQQHIQLPFAGSSSPQQSPEQLAKRRNCSYSNDITSSLSSSKLHSNKRKLYDMREKHRLASGNITTTSTNGNSSSPENSPHQHASKIQRKQPTSDLRLEQLTKTQSTPITPLPATPAQRTVSAPALRATVAQEEAPSKPKLTLFNAQQQREQQPHSLDIESPDVDAGEYAGIQFVKPKQQNSFSGVKNSNLERTQKTKLALMLSSLKGEIYQDEPETQVNDEPDAKLEPTETTKTTTATVAAVTTVTTATTSTISTKPIILGVTTILPATNLGTTTTTSTTTAAAASSSTATTTTPKTTTSNALPLISLNNTAATNATTLTNSSQTSTNSNTNGAGAVLTGFTLSTSTTNSNTTVTSTPLITFDSPKPASGITEKNTPSSTAATITPTAAATAPKLSFGNLPATTSASMFSLGNAATITTTTSNASTTAVATITTSAPVFSFGNAATSATTATTNAVPTTMPATPMFAFGKPASAPATTLAAAAATTTATSTTNKTFSFGNATSNNAAATEATVTPAFKVDNWAAKPLELGTSGSNNSFGAAFKVNTPTTVAAPATTTNNATEPAKLFSFGTSTVTTTAAATAPTAAATPIFGQATTATTATPIFGQAATSAPATTAMPIFGQAAAATSTPSFSFNAAPTPAAPAAAPAASSSNIFAFGGAAAGGGAVVKPVAKAAPFTLPSSNNSGSSNNVFNFGGGDMSKTATPAAAAAAGGGPTNSFTFNAASAAAPATNSNNFSFNAPPKQTPIFGGNNSSNTTAPAAKPFTFGGIAGATDQQQQQQQQSTAGAGGGIGQAAPRSGGFSFAAVAQKNESSNLFGSPAATTTTPTTGIVKPSFNFGGNSTPAATAAPTAAATFGSFATPAQPANKPFAFGGATTNAPANNAASPMGGNLFANAVAAAQQQQQPKPGGFSFSTTNNNNNGGNNNNVAAPTANANAPFAFGGMTSTPPSNNTAKPFTFGASAQNAPTSNMFGNLGAAAAPTAPSNGGAFNFGGTASPANEMSSTAQQLNSGNVFALPSTPESRPIRRATRRLQK
ncbi:hypothetical protein ACLKA7_008819 [Drosophila subpalustris]